MRQETDEFQVVRLERADQGADLWPAVEAAQYGHIMQRDGDEDAATSRPLGDFLAAFAEVIESWDSAPEVQAALIRKLDAGLSALDSAGYRVHWGMVHRPVSQPGGEPVEIPIAIVRVGPHREGTVEIALPTRLVAVDERADPD